MYETRRLVEAASALSAFLQSRGVPHAFYGDVLISLLANQPLAARISCIVQGGTPHPFRLVRDALHSAEDFSTTSSPWSDRLHVKYHGFIPPIEIEILSAGEEGPRRLDANTIMKIKGLPFLSISEYIRAKLKSWAIRQSEPDSREITYLLNRYWDKVDINRIPEHDMNDFVAATPDVSRAWSSLQKNTFLYNPKRRLYLLGASFSPIGVVTCIPSILLLVQQTLISGQSTILLRPPDWTLSVLLARFTSLPPRIIS